MSGLSFGKNKRLRKRVEFTAVRGKCLNISGGRLRLLAKSNALSSPRLGLVVAKKYVKLATQRNRIKRLIRESFRQRSSNLPCVDIVLLVRESIHAVNNEEFYQCLENLWQQLLKQIERYSSP